MATVAAKGSVEAVVTAMRRHEGVAGVALHGCGALANIAWLGGHRGVRACGKQCRAGELQCDPRRGELEARGHAWLCVWWGACVGAQPWCRGESRVSVHVSMRLCVSSSWGGVASK